MKQLIENSVSPKIELHKAKCLPATPINCASGNSRNNNHQGSFKKSSSQSQSKRMLKSGTCFSGIVSINS